MGRKAKFDENIKEKKGPGRKARKQKDPKFPQLQIEKELSHRQKQRAAKRALKKETLINNQAKKKLLKEENKRKEEVKPEIEDEENNQNGLKVKKITKQKNKNHNNSIESEDDNSEEQSDDEVEEEYEEMEEDDESVEEGDESVEAEEVDEEGDESVEEEEEIEGELENEGEEVESEEEDEEDSELEAGEEMEEDESEEEVEEDSELEAGEEMEEDENDVDMLRDDFMDDNSSSDDDNEEESGSDDELPIEKESKKLKKKIKEIKEQSEAELKDNLHEQEEFQFPNKKDEETLTLADINQRIHDNIRVLLDFKTLRDPAKFRSDYTELLRKDLCTYYGYNDFLMERLMQLFSSTELIEFLEASEQQRPVTIRTNTLKTIRRDLAERLIQRGMNVDHIGRWSSIGLVIFSSQVPIGATPEYLAGEYMIQGASSLLPVMALDPQENERILDLCAAPGGKSTHIAAAMKNSGTLFLNDSNRDRVRAIVGNVHRLGVLNSVISVMDGRKMSKVITGFDRVLVDAPCTGTGIVAKDPSVKTNKDAIDVQRCYQLQRELLCTAIDCTNADSKTGGYIVYSTCSILPEENEWVVDFALKKRNVKLVSTKLNFGTEGFKSYRNLRFHPSMKLTRRFYPHTNNMDGFFVAKFKKFSNQIPTSNDADDDNDDGENESENDETPENATSTDNKKQNGPVKGNKQQKNQKSKVQKKIKTNTPEKKNMKNKKKNLNKSDEKMESSETTTTTTTDLITNKQKIKLQEVNKITKNIPKKKNIKKVEIKKKNLKKSVAKTSDVETTTATATTNKQKHHSKKSLNKISIKKNTNKKK